MNLTDRKALELAKLLGLYLEDCVTIDPATPPPSQLTVLELLEDLAGSTSGPEQREIETALDRVQGLFRGPIPYSPASHPELYECTPDESAGQAELHSTRSELHPVSGVDLDAVARLEAIAAAARLGGPAHVIDGEGRTRDAYTGEELEL